MKLCSLENKRHAIRVAAGLLDQLLYVFGRAAAAADRERVRTKDGPIFAAKFSNAQSNTECCGGTCTRRRHRHTDAKYVQLRLFQYVERGTRAREHGNSNCTPNNIKLVRFRVFHYTIVFHFRGAASRQRKRTRITTTPTLGHATRAQALPPIERRRLSRTTTLPDDRNTHTFSSYGGFISAHTTFTIQLRRRRTTTPGRKT